MVRNSALLSPHPLAPNFSLVAAAAAGLMIASIATAPVGPVLAGL